MRARPPGARTPPPAPEGSLVSDWEAGKQIAWGARSAVSHPPSVAISRGGAHRMARMSAAERRAILIDAAITVMSREGVPHSTTRAIVAEAGMQIGVFHYCFRSKEELVLEVMREISHRSVVAVESAMQSSSDPAEVISSAVEAYWHHIENHPRVPLPSYELTSYAWRQRGNEGAAVAQYEYSYAAMAEGLRKAAEAGGFEWRTRVDALPPFVLAIVEGVTFQWLVNKDVDRARVLIDQLVDHLRRDAALEPSPAPTV